MDTFALGSQRVWMHPAGEGQPQSIVWLLAGEMTPDRLALLNSALPDCLPGVLLTGFGPVEWNQDYAPWPLDTPDGRHFGSGADALIRHAVEEVLPAVHKRSGTDGPVFCVGYSLGGLAALYAACQSDVFSGAGSCSGSLWYPEFLPWLRAHRPQCPVYLSLGGREKNTRDPLMAQVESKTQEAFDLLRSTNRTTFVHEPGGHFSAPETRLAHAVSWLLTLR